MAKFGNLLVWNASIAAARAAFIIPKTPKGKPFPSLCEYVGFPGGFGLFSVDAWSELALSLPALLTLSVCRFDRMLGPIGKLGTQDPAFVVFRRHQLPRRPEIQHPGTTTGSVGTTIWNPLSHHLGVSFFPTAERSDLDALSYPYKVGRRFQADLRWRPRGDGQRVTPRAGQPLPKSPSIPERGRRHLGREFVWFSFAVPTREVTFPPPIMDVDAVAQLRLLSPQPPAL